MFRSLNPYSLISSFPVGSGAFSDYLSINIDNEFGGLFSFLDDEEEQPEEKIPVVVAEPKEYETAEAENVDESEEHLEIVTDFSTLPSLIRSVLEEELARLIRALSVRTRNAFSSHLTLEGMVDFRNPFYRPLLSRLKGCGKRGLAEYGELVDNFWSFYFKTLDRYGNDPESLKEFSLHLVEQRYPYIKSEEGIREATRLLLEGKPLAPEFLFYEYVRSSSDLAARIVMKMLGASEDARSRLMIEAASENVRSRERIRQILLAPIQIKGYEEDMEGAFKDVDLPYVASDDSIWEKLRLSDVLPFLTPVQMMGLAMARLGNYNLIDFTDKQDYPFMVKKHLLRNIRIKKAYTSIISRINIQRTEENTIDILPYLKDALTEEGENDNLEEVVEIIIRTLMKEGLASSFEGTVATIPPNKFDKMRGMMEILRENGSPMHFNELSAEYYRRYPDHPFSSPESIKSYALRTPGIVPIGKSGYYALTEWNTYTGTITAKLYDILAAHSSPVSLDDLVKEAKGFFPGTTPERIAGLIYADKGDRFMVFADNLYGVKANKANYDMELRPRSEVSRKNPEVRLRELEIFIRQEGRFPYSAAMDAHERTLYNWMGNVKGEILSCSDEIRKGLENLSEKYPLAPRTGDDIRFYLHCKEFMDYLRAKRRFPTGDRHDKMRRWFHATRYNFKNLSPLREYYFSRILSFMRRHGINY